MRKKLFWLSDEQWRRIEPRLPTDVRGVERADDRRVISGIVHILKSGCRWCDCPPEQAGDFVRLHPDEETFWSSELCFVSVPIQGVKNGVIHLIDEDVAMRNLPDKKIQRFRLALATKPYDVFFLCHVPTQNLDNKWNSTNLEGCEQAKTLWTELNSRKAEGIDGYKIDFATNPKAFPEPTWPTRSLDALIVVTFQGYMIDHDRHPGLLRLIGDK